MRSCLDKPVVHAPVSTWERHPELSGESAGEEGRIVVCQVEGGKRGVTGIQACALPNSYSPGAYGRQPTSRRHKR